MSVNALILLSVGLITILLSAIFIFTNLTEKMIRSENFAHATVTDEKKLKIILPMWRQGYKFLFFVGLVMIFISLFIL